MNLIRNYTGIATAISLAAFFYPRIVAAQIPSVQTTADKRDILIGEQVHLKIDVTLADNTYRLSWFSVPDSFGTFVVVSSGKIDSGFNNGNQLFSQELTLTSFDSGQRVIPPLELQADALTNDSSYTLFTDSIPVNVGYSPLDSVKTFHDIKTIIEVKEKWPWWAWALIVLGVMLVVLAIIFRKKLFGKKEKPAQIIDAKVGPYDEAMKSLQKLEAEGLPAKGAHKEFHLRLTDIFKRYFTRQTNRNKLHLTSDEILMDLDQEGINRQEVSAFANCLRMSNAVKFAKFVPAPEQNQSCLLETKKMITLLNNQVKKEQESAV